MSSPINYATQWCSAIVREADACQSGATYAANQLNNNKSAEEVINGCTNFSVSDCPPDADKNYCALEGYRVGCYLATIFSKDKSNICTTQVQDKTIPYVCPQSCKNVYTSGESLTNCMNQAQQMIQSLGGQPVDYGSQLSCISGVNCTAGAQQCNPLVVGCSIGQLQNQMINTIQQQ
jgi:hypothetical protein